MQAETMSFTSFQTLMDQYSTVRENGLREFTQVIGKTIDDNLEENFNKIRVAEEEVNVKNMELEEDRKHLEAERKRLLREKEVQNTANARLQEMEQQYQRMKEELEGREKKCSVKEEELERREKKCSDKEEELEAREKKCSDKEEDFKLWDKELMGREREIRELECKVTVLQQEHKQEVAIAHERIKNQGNQLRSREDQLIKSEDLNNARKVELEEWSIELEQKQKMSVAREEALSDRERDLDDREGLLNLAEQDLKDKEAAYEKAKQNLKDKEAKYEKAEQNLMDKEAAYEKGNKSSNGSWRSFVDHVDSCLKEESEPNRLPLHKIRRIATILQSAMPDKQLVIRIRSRCRIETNVGFMENENPDSVAVIATETGLDPLEVLISLTNQVRRNLLSHHSSASDSQA